ncbi:MAG: hypothetical protein ACLR8R_10010 [Oscillospiraceae bacterium]
MGTATWGPQGTTSAAAPSPSNYDGSCRSTAATVGDGAFIGCNTNLVAPVTVERGVLYRRRQPPPPQDRPPDALAVARARQVHKRGVGQTRELYGQEP